MGKSRQQATKKYENEQQEKEGLAETEGGQREWVAQNRKENNINIAKGFHNIGMAKNKSTNCSIRQILWQHIILTRQRHVFVDLSHTLEYYNIRKPSVCLFHGLYCRSSSSFALFALRWLFFLFYPFFSFLLFVILHFIHNNNNNNK